MSPDEAKWALHHRSAKRMTLMHDSAEIHMHIIAEVINFFYLC